MTDRLRSIRIPTPLAFVALAGISLLVSHDAIFLVQLGPGEELVRTLRSAGHDYWGAASTLLVAIAVLALAATAVRLRALRRRAATLAAAPQRVGGYARRAARVWVLLAVVVAAGFVVQENVEHVIAHGHAIGLGALFSAEHPLAIPVIAAITAAAALVAALVAGTEHALIASIDAALSHIARRPRRALGLAPMTLGPRSSILSRPGASRAPPSMLAT